MKDFRRGEWRCSIVGEGRGSFDMCRMASFETYKSWGVSEKVEDMRMGEDTYVVEFIPIFGTSFVDEAGAVAFVSMMLH